LSVRLYYKHQRCVEKAKRIIKMFSPSANHTILVFPH